MADVTNTQFSASEQLKVRISNDFRYHPADEAKGIQHDSIRQEMLKTAFFLADVCPYSRELSLALTSLEESMFWANAAIARNE